MRALYGTGWLVLPARWMAWQLAWRVAAVVALGFTTGAVLVLLGGA